MLLMNLENKPMGMGGREEREGEMYGESNMETCITICKIDSQWKFVVWLRKLKQGLCSNQEGWVGREMGGRLKRERMYVYIHTCG